VRSYDVIRKSSPNTRRSPDAIRPGRMLRDGGCEAALFILNSAAETAKEAVDALRKEG